MPKPGDQVGDFKLIREIGRGAVGVVWEAHQASLDRTVAVKFLTGDGGGDPTWKERFRAEAGKAAKLSHAGILPVFALGELEDGQPWFAMELVEGRDLSDALEQDGPMDPERAAEVIRDAAHALHHAHENGIVHRDVKPANLMLRDDGRVVVTDFGLSKQLGSGAMTTTGLLVGTPYYMSPEAVSGDRDAVGPLADVYGLGVTLYELLVGRPPLVADTPIALIRKITDEDPVPAREVIPRLSSDLDTIVMASMAKDPTRRPASAAALADELGRFLSGEAIETQPLTARERLARTISRNKVAFWISAGALVLVAVAIWVFSALLASKDDQIKSKTGEINSLDAELTDMGDELAEAQAIKAGLAGDDAARARARDRFARQVYSIIQRLAGLPQKPPPTRRLAQWKSESPARVTIRVTPPDAEVEVIGLPHRPSFETVTVPLVDQPVPAGLYRIVARAEGHSTTIATVVLPPDSRAEISLTLPAAESRTRGMTYYAGVWSVPAKAGDGPKVAVRYEEVEPYFMGRRVEADGSRPRQVGEAEARQLAASRGTGRLPTESEFWNAVLLAPLATLVKGTSDKPPISEVNAILEHESLEDGLLPVWGTDSEGDVTILSAGGNTRKARGGPRGRGGRRPRGGRAAVRLVLEPR